MFLYKLLNIKVASVLKNCKRQKRTYFILTLLSLLVFIFENPTPIFTFFGSISENYLILTSLVKTSTHIQLKFVDTIMLYYLKN
jgi:hypothetical protein